MKVFISWSGELSKSVGEVLRKYLPCMIQGLDVFMSTHDLASGGRWGVELAAELDQSAFGIVCLAPDNLDAPWILFEAGALTKHLEGGACSLLIGGLKPTDVTGPLAQFQNRAFEQQEFGQLFRDINQRMTPPLDAAQLELIFGKWWPDIEGEYQSAVSASAKGIARAPRGTHDLVEEVLNRVRAIERSLDKRGPVRAPHPAGTARPPFSFRLQAASSLLAGLTPELGETLRTLADAQTSGSPIQMADWPFELAAALEGRGLLEMRKGVPALRPEVVLLAGWSPESLVCLQRELRDRVADATVALADAEDPREQFVDITDSGDSQP